MKLPFSVVLLSFATIFFAESSPAQNALALEEVNYHLPTRSAALATQRTVSAKGSTRSSIDFSLRVKVPHIYTILTVSAATPGNDLGAKYCWADTHLGAMPGEIWIDAGAGTTWTTPCKVHGPRKITFRDGGTYSIPMGHLRMPYATMIDCGGRQQATLHFTGNGTALLFNWLQGGESGSFADWGYGIKDCAIIGPGGGNGVEGNAGIGVQIGDATHETIGVDISSCVIAGFALGITWGNVAAWGTRIVHTNIVSNTQDFLFNVNSSAGQENLLLDHVTFNQYSGGVVVANDFEVTGSGVIDILCMSCSFDNSQINIGGSPFNAVRFESRHTETTVASTVVPIIVTAGVVTDITPLFQWDNPDICPATAVSVIGGTYSIYEGVWGAQPSCPITNGIVEGGSGIVYQNLPYLRNAEVGPSSGAVLTAFYGQAASSVPGCTTQASVGGVCPNPITVWWPNHFLDTNYTVNCTPSGAPTNLPGAPFVVSKAPASIKVNYFATTAAAASWPSIDCQAVHN